jgi:hypothetical protein
MLQDSKEDEMPIVENLENNSDMVENSTTAGNLVCFENPIDISRKKPKLRESFVFEDVNMFDENSPKIAL